MTMPKASPFVKWAGGKRQLLDDLVRCLPQDFADRPVYVEPFIGGGALLLHLLQNYPTIEKAVICEINPALMVAWRCVQSKVEDLITLLEAKQSAYLPLDDDGRKRFYLRERYAFNKALAGENPDPLRVAAGLLFLNRTCFNGLYRVNSQGEFNVPHGRYKNPRILDAENLRSVSTLLRRVEVVFGDFELSLQLAGDLSRTFWYFDPPYKPVSQSASFTSYTAGGFCDAEQERLAAFCRKLDAGGAKFLLSNSDPQGEEAGFFDRLYRGFSIKRVRATRAINSDPRGRGATSEIIVSN